MVTELPSELWLVISGYLSDEEIKPLAAVNRVFFNISLDIRYREITIGDMDSATVRLLKRLQDPATASRVHRLNIVGHVRSERASNDFPSGVSAFRGRVAVAMQALQHSLLSPLPMAISHRPVGPVRISPEDATALLVTVLPLLHRLECFMIDFWHCPSGFYIHPVLSNSWPSFGSHLTTLFLTGHLSTLETVIDTQPSLPNLLELIIQLTDPFLLTVDDNVATLNNYVVPFINSLAPTLRTFMVWSWASLDLSSVFVQLRQFPHLTKFRLRTAFNKSFVSDPSGLSRFIRAHSQTLEELQLWVTCSGAMLDTSVDQPLSRWLHDLANDTPSFPALKDLHIHPSRQVLGFDAFLSMVSKSDILENLIIRDVYFNEEQIRSLLGVLAPDAPNVTLHSLRLNTTSFKGGLFEAMAEKLPELKSLSMHIGDLSTEQETIEQMLQGRKLAHWHLYNVGLWRSGGKVDEDSMRAVQRCIPSVKSFWGMGHTNFELKEEPALRQRVRRSVEIENHNFANI
ncbi:hypothetical protein CYLTODRAFT_486450 [Cylindrobasidium torrendii FP15055 ss-10]|uniref:F-box domain-containing protein n=1 Tax=Cylindrobasidium torrendii FP15055 ss-10 TaxID=1314674 RepID=A0A0D7BQI0_9AGAR|nr:hypothetical protein CYLTODRAFT_486450 [Cylindrobasidium torrendii FP15055 ss-10]